MFVTRYRSPAVREIERERKSRGRASRPIPVIYVYETISEKFRLFSV